MFLDERKVSIFRLRGYEPAGQWWSAVVCSTVMYLNFVLSWWYIFFGYDPSVGSRNTPLVIVVSVEGGMLTWLMMHYVLTVIFNFDQIPYGQPKETTGIVRFHEVLAVKVYTSVVVFSANGDWLGDKFPVDRDPQSILDWIMGDAEYRQDACGFFFRRSAVTSLKLDGNKVELSSEDFDQSCTYWIQGEEITLEDAKKRVNDNQLGYAYQLAMDDNRIILDRLGSVQHLGDDDVILNI